MARLKKPIQLRWRILIPLIAGFTLLITAFAVALFSEERTHFEESLRRDLDTIAAYQSSSITLRGEKLAAVADTLSHDPELIQALSTQDRNALLTYGLPYFKRLKQDYNITHFYFHDAQRRTLLRLHNPDSFGDRNERVTARQAEQTGRPAVGVELGKTGTYTQRAVVPVSNENRLIGYIELGEETLDGLIDLAQDFQVDGYVLLYKAYLDRNDWEHFMVTLGRMPDWNRYPETVLVAQTRSEIPDLMKNVLDERSDAVEQKGKVMAWGKQTYNVGSAPLLDAASRKVGQLVVLRDVTALSTQTDRSLIWFISATVIGGALFSVFLYYHLKKTENELERANVQMLNTAKAREADQRRHIEELTGRINDLEHFERLTVRRELRIQALKAENRRLRSLADGETHTAPQTEAGLEDAMEQEKNI